MVFDTLFALDSHLAPQPMMVETEQVSADGLTYTFTLRSGAEIPRRQPGHLARRGGLAGALDERPVDGTATQGAHGVA